MREERRGIDLPSVTRRIDGGKRHTSVENLKPGLVLQYQRPCYPRGNCLRKPNDRIVSDDRALRHRRRSRKSSSCRRESENERREGHHISIVVHYVKCSYPQSHLRGVAISYIYIHNNTSLPPPHPPPHYPKPIFPPSTTLSTGIAPPYLPPAAHMALPHPTNWPIIPQVHTNPRASSRTPSSLQVDGPLGALSGRGQRVMCVGEGTRLRNACRWDRQGQGRGGWILVGVLG